MNAQPIDTVPEDGRKMLGWDTDQQEWRTLYATPGPWASHITHWMEYPDAPPTTYVEDKEFDVTVTVAFRTNVWFAPCERDGPITAADALANFMGSGLQDILDEAKAQGEYGVTIVREQIYETT